MLTRYRSVAAAAASQLLRQLQQGLGDALRLGGALAATLERGGGTRSGKLTGGLRDRGRGRGNLTATAAAASNELLTSTAGVAATAAGNELLTSTAGVAATAATSGRGTRRKICGGQRARHLFYTSLEKDFTQSR
jgi:hypothetical protein